MKNVKRPAHFGALTKQLWKPNRKHSQFTNVTEQPKYEWRGMHRAISSKGTC